MNDLLAQALNLHQTGDWAGANQIYGQILLADPLNATALHLKGVLAQQAGDLHEARRLWESALHLEPREVVYLNNLGLCYDSLGRTQEAVEIFSRGLKLQPDVPELNSNMAKALSTLGRYVEAEAHARKALQLKPRFDLAYNNLGVALTAQERAEEAVSAFQNALAINPQLVSARRNLAHALRDLGRFEEARRQYEEVIRLDPRETMAHYSLTLTRRYTNDDHSEMDRVERLLERDDLAVEERARLNFALGKICDDCGLYDKAFRHFDRGNSLVRPHFDRVGYAKLVADLVALCQADRLPQMPSSGISSQEPVFIVGMPRSGTSLVEQIVASHPQVYGCGELNDIHERSQQLAAASGGAFPWPLAMRHLSPESLQTAADAYLARCRMKQPGKTFYTNKAPFNVLHLGLIWQMFPSARIIYCRREPLDTCLSCFFLDFTERLPFAYSLGDIGFFHRLCDRLMAHWRSVLPLRFVEVQYEDLVCDAERHTRRLIDSLGLPWDDRCARFHETQRTVRTSSNWQVRQPVYQHAVARWRNYARHLGPLYEALGMAAPNGSK